VEEKMTPADWKTLVTWVMCLTAVAWIVLDTFALELGGPNGADTESTTIGTWLDASVWFTAAFSALVGHFYASGSTSITWRHLAVAAAAGGIGYLVTRLS
jgi:hypothetical protein